MNRLPLDYKYCKTKIYPHLPHFTIIAKN